jgi:hypothetical protein
MFFPIDLAVDRTRPYPIRAGSLIARRRQQSAKEADIRIPSAPLNPILYHEQDQQTESKERAARHARVFPAGHEHSARVACHHEYLFSAH